MTEDVQIWQQHFSVISNEKLSDCFYRLVVDAKSICEHVQAGQFVHIRVADQLQPFFRRPFSVYRAKEHLEVFYEVVGQGTEQMSQYQPGDQVDILGPLGQPFRLPESHIKNVVMVAGGIGIAPFLLMTDVLAQRGLNLILLYGGRTAGHVYPMAEFKGNGCQIHVATDDGSHGVKGRVTELFDHIPDPDQTVLYTCGPHAMMAAVQDFAVQKGYNGQAACEEVMACALGACLGCTILTKSGYKTVCYDGPVFELDELIFSH